MNNVNASLALLLKHMSSLSWGNRRFSVFWLQRTGEIPDEPIVHVKYFDADERPENLNFKFRPQSSVDLFGLYAMITIAERKTFYYGECFGMSAPKICVAAKTCQSTCLQSVVTPKGLILFCSSPSAVRMTFFR